MLEEYPERPKGELRQGLRRLRSEAVRKPTPAERIMWAQLRDSRFEGHKFRREYTVERYRADFYCAARRLILEIDGSIHDLQKAEDAARQAELERHGFRFLRFSNDQVFNDLPTVLNTIRAAL
jgi:very-short-patch-repair endonuclease